MTRTLLLATVCGFVTALLVSLAVNLLSLQVQGPYLGVVAGAASGVSAVALWSRSARQREQLLTSAQRPALGEHR